MALSEKQQCFVEEYAKDYNAKQAAIRAGYSAHTAEQQGYRLLKHVQVKAEIEQRLTDHLEVVKAEAVQAVLSRHQVLLEDSAIATSNLWDLIERVTSRGIIWKDINELPVAIQRLVQEVAVDPDKGAVKIKMHSKHPSLERLAKHYQLFSGPGTAGEEVSPETVPAMARRAATWLRKMCVKLSREPAQVTAAEVIALLEHPPDKPEHAPAINTRSGGMLSDPRADPRTDTRTLREIDDGETD